MSDGCAIDMPRGSTVWLGAVRERLCADLEESRFAALHDRIEADLAAGRHAALIPELAGLVVEHPLREGMHSMLMLALHRSGRRAEAVAVFRRVRWLLAGELGLEPGPQLRRVEADIIADRPVPHLGRAV
jgi:DNA-binding SARP family transcriptional activator